MIRRAFSWRLLLVSATVALTGFVVVSKAEGPKPPQADAANREAKSAATLAAKLALPITIDGVEGVPLKEVVQFLSERFNVAILIDLPAFMKYSEIQDIENQSVKLPRMTNVRLRTALRRLLTQVDADFLQQDGAVVVVPRSRATSVLREPVHATFTERPLEEALQDLAESTGVSVVVDLRVGAKAKAPVNANLVNVPMETAVRVLADMVDLKSIRMDNLLYVTTPAKAKEWGLEMDSENPACAPGPTKKTDELKQNAQ
jgi:hypothetical protein